MEFRLDDGQIELQQTVERFFTDRFPLDSIVVREGIPVEPGTWRELAAMGVTGLLVDGLGALDAAIVFEQVGSHLVPGPLLWTVLAAPFVDGAATGDVLVGGVDAGSDLVEHAADLDALLVLDGDQVVLHEDLPEPESLHPLDPLTPVGRFRDLGAGTPIADATELRVLGTVLSASALVGIAARALETARSYALERHQFDVPIGSFQAVKHLLADMYVRTNLAQSATYAAAELLEEPAAAAAKLLAAEAAIEGAGTAIQILGGMGFTWDMLPNHLLKRAWVLEHAFGTADDHAADLGGRLVAAAS